MNLRSRSCLARRSSALSVTRMVLLAAALSLISALTVPLAASATVSEQSNRAPGVKQVETSLFYSCALLENSEVRCWGVNRDGQLGDGTTENSSVPVAVKAVGDPNANLTRVEALASGTTFGRACAILKDSRVACWGSNSFGALGIDIETEKSLTPVIVRGVGGRGDLKGVKQVVIGIGKTCALMANSGVACWGSGALGSNAEKEVDPESGDEFSSTPLIVQDTTGRGQLRNVTELSDNGNHTCALLNTGRAVCWGSNFFEQLGAGTTEEESNVPLFAVGADGETLTNVKQVAAGIASTCVLFRNGDVDCWGGNTFGTLGDGTTTSSVTPVAVKARDGRQGRLSKVSRLEPGDFGTCALLTTGRAVCWGAGPVGNGSEERSSVPVTVSGAGGQGELTRVTQISPGLNSCALQKRNQVTCWGNNFFGAIGDGTNDNSSVPVAIVVR